MLKFMLTAELISVSNHKPESKTDNIENGDIQYRQTKGISDRIRNAPTRLRPDERNRFCAHFDSSQLPSMPPAAVGVHSGCEK